MQGEFLMNKKILVAIMALMLVLTACSVSEEEGSKEGDKEKSLSQVKEIDSYEIEFLTAKELSSEDKKVLQLNFKVENKSADSRMFDSLVFSAENSEGKKLGISPNENFGSELKPGEVKEGSIYYYLEGSAPIVVTYNDLESEKTESWEIKEIN